MGSQRVGHNLVTEQQQSSTFIFYNINILYNTGRCDNN